MDFSAASKYFIVRQRLFFFQHCNTEAPESDIRLAFDLALESVGMHFAQQL